MFPFNRHCNRSSEQGQYSLRVTMQVRQAGPEKGSLGPSNQALLPAWRCLLGQNRGSINSIPNARGGGKGVTGSFSMMETEPQSAFALHPWPYPSSKKSFSFPPKLCLPPMSYCSEHPRGEIRYPSSRAKPQMDSTPQSAKEGYAAS